MGIQCYTVRAMNISWWKKIYLYRAIFVFVSSLLFCGHIQIFAKRFVYFARLLEYCIQKGGYKGCKYSKDVVADLSEQFSEMMRLL